MIYPFFDYNEYMELRIKHIPKKDNLYHYTKCSSLKSILATKILYATKSSFLNDTNEMDYITHVIKEVIEELPDSGLQELLLSEVVNTIEESKRHDTFVCSFSTDKDSITLWSEFGDNTGYNVAFRADELLTQIRKKKEIFYHGHVIYSREVQKHLIEELFEDVKKEDDFTLLKRKLNTYALFFKQEEFAAEKEYRIVFRNPHKQKILFREKEGFLLPYIEIQLDTLPIDCVTVAPKNHVDLAKKGMTQYLESLGYDVDVNLSKLKLRY